MNPKPASLRIYLALLITLVVLRILLVFIPSTYMEAVPGRAALFTWPALIVMGVLGLAGLWLSARTGFPGMWDRDASYTHILLVPLAVGIGLGLVFFLLSRLEPVEAFWLAIGEVEVPFPFSIPYYAYGATLSEILLRLFLIPLLVWPISSLLLRGRWQEPIFWAIALVTSVLEPLGNLAALAGLGWLDGGLALPVALLLLLSFGINLLAAYLFRKYGFMAALSLRLGHYLMWHVGL